jgi:hypothetical protein
VGAAIGRAWTGEESCHVQIEASWGDDEHHYVVLSFRSVSEHGVYLETLSIVDPRGVDLELRSTKWKSMSLDEKPTKEKWVEPGEVLPTQLPTGADIAERLWRRTCDRGGEEGKKPKLSFGGMLTFEYICSQVDKPKPTKKRLMVQLRETGPAYRKA